MVHVHDKKTMGKKPDLDKGFGITKDDKNRAVAVDYTIDTNRRAAGDGKVNKSEPKMTD
jgi:hypothetical protein